MQIQQRLMDALDKINNLPINPLLEQATSTLAQSENDAARAGDAGQSEQDNVKSVDAAATGRYAEYVARA